MSLLPHRLAGRFASIERFGFIILILALVSGALGFVLWPLIELAIFGLVAVFGFSPLHLFQLVRSL